MPHVHVLGTDKLEDHNGIITFTVDGVHPHDISEIMASDGVNIRAGHHCAQPLLTHLGLNATLAPVLPSITPMRTSTGSSRASRPEGAYGIWKIEVSIMRS